MRNWAVGDKGYHWDHTLERYIPVTITKVETKFGGDLLWLEEESTGTVYHNVFESGVISEENMSWYMKD